ncbi:Paxillin [Sarcoptes scabiei]|nr:Paxillin [Sarcoptes scabiei]
MASAQYQVYSESSYSKEGGYGSKSPIMINEGGISSAFDGSPSSGLGTSTQDYSYTSSSTPVETVVTEYQTPDGGLARRVMKTFTTEQTTTRTTRYGSDGSLKTETYGSNQRRISPMPARSSSSMSKLSQVEERSCSSESKQKTQSKPSNDGGYRLYSMERREETTRSSNGGARTPTTPTSYRKVKFNDESYENEFQQACSSLSNKDIDILPDPDLDNDISLYSMEKTHTRQAHRIKSDGEKFEYNDFAMIPPTASKSPLPHRKTETRDRSPAATIDPRAPSPIHQLTVPQKFMEIRTPSPKDKIESEHNCKYHSHHLDYKYTPPPVKGPCGACGQYIVGSLVTALDKMWHPECFTCTNCDTILKPHKYVVEDDKPYCKDCHLRLFGPPCSVCKKPTQSNRYNLLNRIWHPECFCCVECGKRLTPDNFIERLGSPYCMEDYHRLFSPKCCVCHLPIKDKAINALGKMWHPHCFKCTHCGIPLEERNFYEKNGLPYCEKDYMNLFHPKCYGCKKPITDGRQMMAMGHPWHPECFRCTVCVKPLTPETFKEYQGKPYCEKDYHNLFSPKCAGCKQPIIDNNYIRAMGKDWHPDCFKCTQCKVPLDPENFYEKNGLPYCEKDYFNLFHPKCYGCTKPIQGTPLRAMGHDWHPECFNCDKCHVPLSPDNFYEKNGRPYCENCFHKLYSPKCCACNKPIKGKPVFAMGKEWHPECFVCSYPSCGRILSPDDFEQHEGKPYCKYHFGEMFLPKCFACKKPIKDKVVSALGKTWHPECFACVQCGVPLDLNAFREKDGLPYCEADYHALFSPKCAACEAPIVEKCLTALNKTWHPEHFTCAHCNKPMSDDPDGYHEHESKGYCRPCYIELFAPYCRGCNKPIVDKICVTALNSKYHTDCFVCRDCGCALKNGNYFEFEGEPYCEEHFRCKMCPDCVRLRRAQNKFFSGVQQQNQQVMPTGKATLIESKQDSKQPAFGTLPAQSGQQQKVTFANGLFRICLRFNNRLCLLRQPIHRNHITILIMI